MDDALKARTLRLVAEAPAWVRHGSALFVHGGFHTEMLEQPSPDHGLDRPHGPLARALYGEPTGRMQPDGYPERSLRWVDRIPEGMTVYCGHDRRSHDGRPYVRHGMLAERRCSSTPAQEKAGICLGSICLSAAAGCKLSPPAGAPCSVINSNASAPARHRAGDQDRPAWAVNAPAACQSLHVATSTRVTASLL